MTMMPGYGTLAGMDEKTRRGLIKAADAVTNGPDRLRALIIKAARDGESPAEIHRVIFPAYTYDYVTKVIRRDKAAQAQAELQDCA
jgi:alkylhydroperoxidase/carboxymuconolactone decarboxylase family protein YurZ